MTNSNHKKEKTVPATRFQDAGIKRASGMTGLPYTALRYYEDMGLIHTKRDENSNYRVYSQSTMIELSDVVIYRNLNIPVEDIHQIMNSSIRESEQILNEAAESTVRKINEMTSSLNELYHKKDKIAHYYRLRSEEERIVDRVDIRQVETFDYDDKEDMRRYIQNPYSSSFITLLEDITHPEELKLGLESDGNLPEDIILWEPAEEAGEYYKCLLRTEYGEGDFLNLNEKLKQIRSLGYEAVSLIGKYIISDLEEDTWYDYYESWIKVKKK